ncbi:MAG: 2-C-methyl-D-erythritol 4-phosphate cytidylyltransferase [Alloprevotella sp.]
MTRNIAIVLAGGTGSRMGGNCPKQFRTLAGCTVLEHSLAAFERNGLVDEVAVVMHPQYHGETQKLIAERGWKKVKRLLESGAERWGSTLSALKAFEGEDANLIFHDAARPLVSQRIITEVCEALRSYQAVGVGIASVDTLMEVENGLMTHVPDRSVMQRMQTPQAFRLATITEAYRLALADPHFKATDDCSVVLKYLPDTPIYIIRGEERNLKLTYADDLLTLERLAAQPETDGQHDRPEGADTDPMRYLKAYQRRHLREMQRAELEILTEVARVCEAEGIPYWLDSGTLLGAVRHGGFIPWDDDIDICMPAEEIPRFVKAAQQRLPKHLQVQTPDTEPELRMPVCKVRDLNSFMVEADDDFAKGYAKGLFIDIFPMHDWPSFGPKFSKKVARGYCRANAILHAQHTYSWRACAELFYFGVKRTLFKLAWTVGSLFVGKGKYYSNTLNNSGNGNRHLRSSIFPLGTIQFEGRTFAAPAAPDAYLKDLFGNYMALPPEDQRTGHACFYVAKLT